MQKIILGILCASLVAVLVIPWACMNEKQVQSQVGQGNNCLADISNCDVTGTYNLTGTDVAPLFVYSASLPISQKDSPGTSATEVSISPFFYFYTASSTYIFRSVGYGTWDGDSLKATIHGKLRSNTSGYPAVGGFAVTLKLDAKQKTYTTAYYYSQLSRMTLPSLDGTMILSDSAHVIFPVTDNKTKAMFTQF